MKNREKDKKMMLEALDVAKAQLQQKGTIIVQKVIEDVLQLENFGDSPETFHTVQEGHLISGLFMCHAVAIDRFTHLIVEMVKDNILVPDSVAAGKAAKQKCKDVKELFRLAEEAGIDMSEFHHITDDEEESEDE